MDASTFATGAILEQPDAFNQWHPIAYYSKSLQPVEQNYKIHDLELLAIIHALETFRHYLEGRDDTLEIWSDHGNLVYFTTKQKLSCRQACWALYLSRFKFIIVTGVDPITIRQSLIPSSLRPLSSQGEVE